MPSLFRNVFVRSRGGKELVCFLTAQEFVLYRRLFSKSGTFAGEGENCIDFLEERLSVIFGDNDLGLLLRPDSPCDVSKALLGLVVRGCCRRALGRRVA